MDMVGKQHYDGGSLEKPPMLATRIPRAITFVVLVLLCGASGSGFGTQATEGTRNSARTSAGTPVSKLQLHGVANFGEVTPTLYRGAQPTAEGLENLKVFGVQAVVNFRNEPERIAAERRIVERLGMRYVSIPWRGRDKPSDAQVAEFLSFLQANPGTRIYVHCRRGAERTGLMVAAFRMTTQGWTPSQALAEMETFGFRGFRFRHLKRYVKEFPERFPQSLPSSPANPGTFAPRR